MQIEFHPLLAVNKWAHLQNGFVHFDQRRGGGCVCMEDATFCSREFGVKCAKCCRNIQATDWVRRARENVYHLACFACDACKRQLSTGEEFALQENRVLCKTHYVEAIEGGPGSDENSNQKQKTKRVRTTFTEEQLQVLQANFQLDSNPDGQDLERIAQITGLSKRVTQVWFQNSRARQKKHQQTTPCGRAGAGGGGNAGGTHSNVSLCDSIMTSSSLSSGSPSPASSWPNGLHHESMIFAS
ncbi:hypothetical protein CAPTEDRAFT_221751 [Capitella teleta]|uniref:Arrowhead n=1 Tax=Capitella teleta TaxID=283909 RepID=R7UAK3_CAPTE|nr:hypothetical protein CAPTEDRAFT_221751 [Capitella teleta]|eukprot:ELU00843.1 hypothetical protein CAPTEDRAFT_221751 [Capitella teleta]